MKQVLRLLTIDDVPEMTSLLRDQSSHLEPWEPRRGPEYFTEAVQRDLAEQTLEDFEAGTRVPFLICDENGALVGVLNLNGIVRGAFQSCAMGYWVRSDRAGRGYATEAVKEAVKFAFTELDLHRVQAETLAENVASQRVLARNGFQLFGAAPEYLKINGHWRDHLMFQKLNRDHGQ